MLTKTKTYRGFDMFEFKDMYGAECSIQKSSLADEDAIWLGVDDPDPKILHSDAKKRNIQTDVNKGWIPYPIPEEVLLTTRMHLTRDQVKILMPILQRFIDTGEI